MDPSSVNPLSNLDKNDCWVVTKNTNGKTKVASCNSDETTFLNQTRNNWVTFHDSACSKDNEENDKIESQVTFKPIFQQVRTNNIEKQIGCYLIRDLLNFKKHSFSKAFIADNLPLTRVMICARIASYQQKDNVYRLILDDGTSNILCLVKIKDECQDSTYEEEISEKIETPFGKIKEDTKNNPLLWVMKKLNLQEKKMTEDSALSFNETSLGRPVRILGNLREFRSTTFIFSYNFRWISEQYYIKFLRYIINSYEYKENYMLE